MLPMGRRLGTIFIAAMVATLAGSAYSQKQTPEQLAAEKSEKRL
jgi:hypothetical protein